MHLWGFITSIRGLLDRWERQLYIQVQQYLQQFIQQNLHHQLRQGRIGLEKESLRVSADGIIAPTPHPKAFGAALTHPYITTDFAEPMLELITPPQQGLDETLQYLDDLHRFVYQHLDDEYLWASSMPCVLNDNKAIPIANYGRSNVGRMRTIYRRGLSHRYGASMQVISGVHFNYSFSDEFWQSYQSIHQSPLAPQDFINQHYFGLIRNLQRNGWLVSYLFGASPAVCKSFLHGKIHPLAHFDPYTDYEPDGVSMRMGDIGYQNHQEDETGVKANYDNVIAYVDSLTQALGTSHPLYEKIGLIKAGKYRQLNTALLQIENEYYSTVRPKQILQANERPVTALRQRGVQYVELRSLDVNIFEPLGVSEAQLRFLQLLFYFCLFQPSPKINLSERKAIDDNQQQVAHHGRNPQLKLQQQGQSVFMRDWGLSICENMQEIAATLDQGLQDNPYQQVLTEQIAVLKDPDKTPAAQMLQQMRDNKESFFQFSERLSQQHRAFFKSSALSKTKQQNFQKLAQHSLQQQQKIEQQPQLSFAEFLALQTIK